MYSDKSRIFDVVDCTGYGLFYPRNFAARTERHSVPRMTALVDILIDL